MTNTRKTRARKLSQKSGMTYQAAINVLEGNKAEEMPPVGEVLFTEDRPPSAESYSHVADLGREDLTRLISSAEGFLDNNPPPEHQEVYKGDFFGKILDTRSSYQAYLGAVGLRVKLQATHKNSSWQETLTQDDGSEVCRWVVFRDGIFCYHDRETGSYDPLEWVGRAEEMWSPDRDKPLQVTYTAVFKSALSYYVVTSDRIYVESAREACLGRVLVSVDQELHDSFGYDYLTREYEDKPFSLFDAKSACPSIEENLAGVVDGYVYNNLGYVSDPQDKSRRNPVGYQSTFADIRRLIHSENLFRWGVVTLRPGKVDSKRERPWPVDGQAVFTTKTSSPLDRWTSPLVLMGLATTWLDHLVGRFANTYPGWILVAQLVRIGHQASFSVSLCAPEDIGPGGAYLIQPSRDPLDFLDEMGLGKGTSPYVRELRRKAEAEMREAFRSRDPHRIDAFVRKFTPTPLPSHLQRTVGAYVKP